MLFHFESYFGSGLQTLHTLAGVVSLTSLAVAAIAASRRLWAAAPSQVSPATAVSAEPKPVAPLADLRAVPRLEPEDDDVEPTVVASTAELDVPAPPVEPASLAGSAEVSAPRVLLMCQNNVEPDEATSPHARILVTASGVSDRGKKRRTNEDCFLLLHDYSVFAVADGMGGYNGGEIASALAVNAIRETFEQRSFDNQLLSSQPLPRRTRELACSLLEANRAVLSMARSKPELSGMGTTLVAARFSPNKQRVYVGNVGDSRCYRFRAGELVQLTVDHTMRGLGHEGPQKNQLYRAIGVEQKVDIDIVVDIPQAEDRYLLCSDGLPKMLSSEQIEAILRSESDVELAAHRLIELANEAGGRDNVTVVLVRIQDRISRVDGLVKSGSARASSPRGLGSEPLPNAVNATELTQS